jgi:phospholipid/cholesterol/gamma-HCH transport system permease protein
LPVIGALLPVPDGSVAHRAEFDCRGLRAWDSCFVVFVRSLTEELSRRGIDLDRSELPEGVIRLLALADSAPRVASVQLSHHDRDFLEEIGLQVLAFLGSIGELIRFGGEVSLAFGRLVRGRARFRYQHMFRTMQEVGAEALPIVSLISLLVGLILAYIGSLQLGQFGANEFVANLVAVAMTREMAAMMTGIIMAGRTGAAFAAQLGTMNATEEIDALRTAAIPPMEFLVLPRILALIIMLPLLTVYANVMGMAGGALLATSLLDVELLQYTVQKREAVGLADLATGLIKAGAYGVIVAVSGCLRGLQCGRTAAEVGDATTSAVVTSIVFIVVCSATLTVLFQILGI